MSLAKQARDDQTFFPGADFVLHGCPWDMPRKDLFGSILALTPLCPIKEINGFKFTLSGLLRPVGSNETGKGALRSR